MNIKTSFFLSSSADTRLALFLSHLKTLISKTHLQKPHFSVVRFALLVKMAYTDFRGQIAGRIGQNKCNTAIREEEVFAQKDVLVKVFCCVCVIRT